MYIMIFRYLNLKLFIISLAIGLLYVYIAEEYKTTIFIYPTPEHIKKYNFRDKTDTCFTYELEKVECPLNVTNVPLQR